VNAFFVAAIAAGGREKTAPAPQPTITQRGYSTPTITTSRSRTRPGRSIRRRE
jgi:hypothetical protein